MKKIIPIIAIALLSCQKAVDVTPVYANFENDLERKNLYGKVKSITQFKATFEDSNGEKLRKQIKTFKEEFTRFGATKKTEYYNTFGDLQQVVSNEFDTKERLISSITTDNFRPSRMEMRVEYDSLNHRVLRDIIVNDSIEQKFIEEYDGSDNMVKRIILEKKDTLVWNYERRYDGNNKLIYEKAMESNEGDFQIIEWKYDGFGNVIENQHGNNIIKFKYVSEYSDNRLIKRTQYVISGDTKEHLDNITTYDSYFNPINNKTYENSELDREFRNDYELDRKGNWIEKRVSLKEHYANKYEFTPAFLETREIEYWE